MDRVLEIAKQGVVKQPGFCREMNTVLQVDEVRQELHLQDAKAMFKDIKYIASVLKAQHELNEAVVTRIIDVFASKSRELAKAFFEILFVPEGEFLHSGEKMTTLRQSIQLLVDIQSKTNQKERNSPL